MRAPFNGLEFVDASVVTWLRAGVTREQVVEGLRPLLDLPLDVVLATTAGRPTERALERALLTEDPDRRGQLR